MISETNLRCDLFLQPGITRQQRLDFSSGRANQGDLMSCQSIV